MKIITANRLLDGAVVYRTAAGGWAEAFPQAERFADDQAAQALAEAEKDVLLVIRPYLVALDGPEEFTKRGRVREAIRAAGPTVRLDLGKQQEGGR